MLRQAQQPEAEAAARTAGAASRTGSAAHPPTGAYAAGHKPRSPWPALWALVIGFFMILVDTTIVSVANPAIKAALDPDTNNLDNVVWVTSAYLLAYAVPLLITGRLGDRFGPKNIYLIGLVGLHARVARGAGCRERSRCSSSPARCRASAPRS